MIRSSWEVYWYYSNFFMAEQYCPGQIKWDYFAVTVIKNSSTAISTNFPVNSVIFLVYTLDGTTAYWKAHDYDANTRNSVGDYRKNSTKLYFVGTTTSDSSTSSSYATSYTNSNCYVGTDNNLYDSRGLVANDAEL